MDVATMWTRTRKKLDWGQGVAEVEESPRATVTTCFRRCKVQCQNICFYPIYMDYIKKIIN